MGERIANVAEHLREHVAFPNFDEATVLLAYQVRHIVRRALLIARRPALGGRVTRDRIIWKYAPLV